ncbi:MAG: metallophosphoesterase [Spirochaetales bacterium]|nr:metallophosphoesterase [Spirochaetales bacterium]
MKKRKKLRVLLIVILIFGIYSLLEPHLILTRTHQIKDKDVPEDFEDYKIVFITDIHHGPFFSRRRVERLIQSINEMSPDLVLLGGDYVHRSSEYIDPFFKEVSFVKALPEWM